MTGTYQPQNSTRFGPCYNQATDVGNFEGIKHKDPALLLGPSALQKDGRDEARMLGLQIEACAQLFESQYSDFVTYYCMNILSVFS